MRNAVAHTSSFVCCTFLLLCYAPHVMLFLRRAVRTPREVSFASADLDYKYMRELEIASIGEVALGRSRIIYIPPSARAYVNLDSFPLRSDVYVLSSGDNTILLW